MNEANEAIKKGILTVYPDTDKEVVKAVEDYNKRMGDFRLKRKKLREILFAYNITNPLIAFCFIASEIEVVFENPVLNILIIAVYAAVFLHFAIIKDNLAVCTAVSSLLLIIDLRLTILLVLNIVLWLLYRRINNRLKIEHGFPLFLDVQIRYADPVKPVNCNFERF